MPYRIASLFDTIARTVAVALILALLATAGLWYALQRGSTRTITAYFTSTVGLYTQNTVDVQGIAVGKVDDIVPQGPVVRVTLKVSNEVAIPADAKAAIIAPTLVSDRYVQLAPNYTGGPMMPDGAVIPASRTAVPVELDAVYKSLDQLSVALGPNGANKTGALSDVLRSSAAFLGGNGEALKQTITQMAGAVGTLSDNRDNLFATVDNLGQFTNMLAQNDGNVRAFNAQLQDVAGYLSSERGNLSQVLQTLPPALENVARFVRDNRDILRADVGQLAQITDILVRQRAALTEMADLAPLGLGNLTNVYNASSGTLDVRPIIAPNLGLTFDPRAILCGLISPTGPLGTALSGPLSQLPASDPLAAAAAGAAVVCGQLLNPQSVQAALAPFSTLLTELGQANAVNAALANAAGANVGKSVTTPGAPGAPAPGTVTPNVPGGTTSPPAPTTTATPNVTGGTTTGGTGGSPSTTTVAPPGNTILGMGNTIGATP